MTPLQLRSAMPDAALAFRGYNVTNLGRSAELLRIAAYAPIVERRLREGSQIATEFLQRPVDLVTRVREERETSLESYGDAVALVVAMELAQLDLLEHCFDIAAHDARFSFGFSLGEIAALITGGVLTFKGALEIPLRLADDCAALAWGVTLGVLFSRGPALPIDAVRRLCLRINQEGRGVIGISSYLSPNSILMMGQGDTLDRFRELMKDDLGAHVHLRKNQNKWPPLHTPLMWQINVPCRAAEMMHTMPGGFTEPKPPVLSLVTGKFSYNDYNAREILHRWTDHPQRLWDAVYETLSVGVKTIIHVGPEPNIIPATFNRLSENVAAQVKGNVGMRALSAAARRRWLQSMLPSRAALLRAPYVQHILLEDWLIENAHLAKTVDAAATEVVSESRRRPLKDLSS